jgi:hypothetical protein
LREERQGQIHATIKEEAVAEEEDIDDRENIFVQKKEGGVVDKNWVLLDSQSTINQICNPAMLTTIRGLRAHQRYTAMPDLPAACLKETLGASQ